MNRFWKVVKWVTLVFILGNVAIIFSGNHHVYRALSLTVFRGELSPPVDIQWQYPQARVAASNQPQPLDKSENHNQKELTKAQEQVHKELESLAFLVLKADRIVFEKYWQGYSDTSLTNSWSMAKSVIGLLIGIAIDEGKINSAYDKVGKYVPEFKDSELQINHLLSMSSGLDFNEDYINPFAYPSKALFGNHVEKRSIHVDQKEAPGVQFRYLSGNTQILAAVLKRATGQSVSSYLAKKLWQPLGAENPAYWSLDNEAGDERAFCCLHSNARDFARLGLLVNHRGEWNGQQLVSKGYLEQSFTPASLKNEEEEPLKKYGWHWWIADVDGVRVNYARGINGQYILCMPEKDLVVVRLGRYRRTDYTGGHPNDVFEYVRMALEMIN